VKARVAEFQAMIAGGSLVVPSNDEEFEAFMSAAPVATPAG
jgi:hypothetical protein